MAQQTLRSTDAPPPRSAVARPRWLFSLVAALSCTGSGLWIAHAGVQAWWVALVAGAAVWGLCQRQWVQALAQSEGRNEAAGQLPLLQQILPVWQRQIESARSHSEQSTGTILQSFGDISSRLDQAISVTQGGAAALSAQSVDDILAQNDDALRQLLQPMRVALDSRDHVYKQLEPLVEALEELRQVAQQIRQLARRTNMVALNASVEASRAGDKGAGFAVVAQEVRQLATQSSEAVNRMISRTSVLDKDIQSLRVQAAAHDSSDEELHAQADRVARQVIGGLLNSLGQVQQSSRDLRDAGSAVRDQVEQVLIGFQDQDRLSQILSCVTEDMRRLGDWVAQGGDLGIAQAGEWLARLEASYTMEEQRTHHHGNAAIQRETAIEFF